MMLLSVHQWCIDAFHYRIVMLSFLFHCRVAMPCMSIVKLQCPIHMLASLLAYAYLFVFSTTFCALCFFLFILAICHWNKIIKSEHFSSGPTSAPWSNLWSLKIALTSSKYRFKILTQLSFFYSVMSPWLLHDI